MGKSDPGYPEQTGKFRWKITWGESIKRISKDGAWYDIGSFSGYNAASCYYVRSQVLVVMWAAGLLPLHRW